VESELPPVQQQQKAKDDGIDESKLGTPPESKGEKDEPNPDGNGPKQT
jgi:hypothetical protein